MTGKRKGKVSGHPTVAQLEGLLEERGWTQRQLGEAVGQTDRTVRRWMDGGRIGIPAALDKIQLLLSGNDGQISGHLPPSDVRRRRIDEVRRLVTDFNIHRSQGVKQLGTMFKLRREIVVAVKAALRAAGGDDPHFSEIVEEMVELLISDSQPPVEAQEISTVKKSSTMDDASKAS